MAKEKDNVDVVNRLESIKKMLQEQAQVINRMQELNELRFKKIENQLQQVSGLPSPQSTKCIDELESELNALKAEQAEQIAELEKAQLESVAELKE